MANVDTKFVVESLQRCVLCGYPPTTSQGYHSCMYKDFAGHCSQNVLLMDAIELLKNQFPVKPMCTTEFKIYCGACGKRIPGKIGAKYCHKCGRKIDWNE